MGGLKLSATTDVDGQHMGIIPANTQLQTSLQVTTETESMPSHVQLLINTTNSTVIKVGYSLFSIVFLYFLLANTQFGRQVHVFMGFARFEVTIVSTGGLSCEGQSSPLPLLDPSTQIS